MASSINSTSTGSGGLISTGDDSGILNIQTNETTAITVDASQNVGIGTSSPTQKLDVVGTARVANTTGNKYLLVGQSTPSGNDGVSLEFQNSNAQKNWAIRSNWNVGGGLEFCPSSSAGGTTYTTPSVVIDSSGNLLVGQTSQTGNEKFGVTQSAATSFAAYFNATAGNYGYDVVKIRCARGSATNEYNFINCLQVSTLVFQVQANGNVQNTNNSYGAISDIKLKENIVDATPKLADLMQVKVRNYNLKSDPTHKQLGVIAQELEQVFPAMVEEATDKDEEGNSLGTTTKGVKYSVFVPMLIKAIQELKQINDTQAATINALTARVVALETA